MQQTQGANRSHVAALASSCILLLSQAGLRVYRAQLHVQLLHLLIISILLHRPFWTIKSCISVRARVCEGSTSCCTTRMKALDLAEE
jgi:hypothetical protein